MAGEGTEQKPGPPRSPWRFVGISLQMGAIIGLGVAAGWGLDQKLGSAPWGMAGGGLLGTAAATYYLLRELT